MSIRLLFIGLACGALACAPATPSTTADTAFASTPDSAWIDVVGPVLVAFYPVVPNDSLERDQDLATTLDDLAYHIGSAMDSLVASGVTVHFRGGDTLWLRTGDRRDRVVRARDSAAIGYLFADSTQHRAIVYGVRTNIDLIEDARAFIRTGALPRR